MLATLLESQAHRATTRHQPGTLGPTAMKTLRTPGNRAITPGYTPSTVATAGLQLCFTLASCEDARVQFIAWTLIHCA